MPWDAGGADCCGGRIECQGLGVTLAIAADESPTYLRMPMTHSVEQINDKTTLRYAQTSGDAVG